MCVCILYIYISGEPDSLPGVSLLQPLALPLRDANALFVVIYNSM